MQTKPKRIGKANHNYYDSRNPINNRANTHSNIRKQISIYNSNNRINRNSCKEKVYYINKFLRPKNFKIILTVIKIKQIEIIENPISKFFPRYTN